MRGVLYHHAPLAESGTHMTTAGVVYLAEHLLRDLSPVEHDALTAFAGSLGVGQDLEEWRAEANALRATDATDATEESAA